MSKIYSLDEQKNPLLSTLHSLHKDIDDAAIKKSMEQADIEIEQERIEAEEWANFKESEK